jgi:hypothetical protein
LPDWPPNSEFPLRIHNFVTRHHRAVKRHGIGVVLGKILYVGTTLRPVGMVCLN